MPDGLNVALEEKKESIWRTPLGAGIIGGLISGATLLYFIQPILSLVGRLLLWNVQALADYVCQQAALGYTDKYGFLTLLMFFGVGLGFMVIATATYFKFAV